MKKCAHCNRLLSTSKFNKNKTTKDGFQNFCVDCLRANRIKKEVVSCTDCSRSFEVAHRTMNMYWRNRSRLRCKPCRTIYTAQMSSLKGSGANNSNWRGGVTALCLAFYRSSPWRILRRDILKRDLFTCVDCGFVSITKGKDLEVNHIRPRSTHPSIALDPSNLETLCKPCHKIETARMHCAREL